MPQEQAFVIFVEIIKQRVWLKFVMTGPKMGLDARVIVKGQRSDGTVLLLGKI